MCIVLAPAPGLLDVVGGALQHCEALSPSQHLLALWMQSNLLCCQLPTALGVVDDRQRPLKL
jgi:hypothetical protein